MRVYTSSLKSIIWIYIYLVIFEGALRKWIVPGLATPLLIIRDPIAIYGIYLGFKFGKFSLNIISKIVITITLLSFMSALIFGHGNILVALFGSRIFLIHIPFIFIIASSLEKRDIEKIFKHLVIISIFMGWLVIMQFYSPQSAWINKGMAEGSSIGFSGALGYFRPSGTFSFTNGLVLFFSMIFPILLWLWHSNSKIVTKYITISATLIALIIIPFSISRTLLFQAIICLLFYLIVNIYSTRLLFKFIFSALLLVISFELLGNIDFIENGLRVFTARFETANKQEGGYSGIFFDRFLGGLFSAIFNDNEFSYFGGGIGLGTNVGAQLLSGKMQFLVAEGEWGRIIGELGIILGLIVIFLRLRFAFYLVKISFVFRKSNSLPWFLLSIVFLNVVQGQWAQPTSLGFTVITTGLLLASINHNLESTSN